MSFPLPRRRHLASAIESLEPRIAPAALAPIPPNSISADGKSATFLQESGYTLTVKTSKGKFTEANFRFIPSQEGANWGTLEMIDLSFATSGKTFQNAVITTKTERVIIPGQPAVPWFSDIGHLNAAGVDLAGFYLQGDLGQVDAGDANFKTPGLGVLSVYSMGVNAATTQTPDENLNYLKSTIVGQLTTLIVSNGPASRPALGDPFTSGHFANTFLDVVADGNPANDRYASISRIVVEKLVNTSLIPILPNFPDPAFPENSAVTHPTQYDQNGIVTYAAGSIRASGKIGKIEIGGSHGGTGDFSSSIWSRTSIDAFLVSNRFGTDRMNGGIGKFSGSVIVGSPDDLTPAVAKGIISVSIQSFVWGSTGEFSGSIYSEGSVGNLRVIGQLKGGDGAKSGSVYAVGNLGNVNLGELDGGFGDYSGSILARNVLSITAGSLNGGSSPTGHNGIFVNGVLGSLTTYSLSSVADQKSSPALLALLPSPAIEPGMIVAKGRFDLAGNPMPGLAIGKITIQQRDALNPASVDHWTIAAGFGWDVDFFNANNGKSINPYANIGPVSIGGTVSYSAIVAATLPGADGIFGPNSEGINDDVHMPGAPLANVYSKIAGIVVKGPITASTFEAQHITAFRLGLNLVLQNQGPLNDSITVPGLFTIREL